MTAEFEGIAELLLIVLAIICAVQAIFAGLLLWYVKRMAESLGVSGKVAIPTVPHPLPVPPRPAPPAPVGKEVSEPVATGQAVPPAEAAPTVAGPAVPARETPQPAAEEPSRAVDVLGGSPDIQASVRRLCEKYELSDFIIATLDGLVVVSLLPGSSEEAARFSDLYRRKKKPDSPGVRFLEIVHQGEPMLCIAKSGRPLGPAQAKGIADDARKILNWWL
ncbi:MAG TPA: hypothetical protein VEI51_00615 [Methanomicrobiales archaeon]|nr:hypothetical protein [Methanomicrobiales archaeon]